MVCHPPPLLKSWIRPCCHPPRSFEETALKPPFPTLLFALKEQWIMICLYALVISNVVGYILVAVSLFTLTAISVDRLLALLSGLRYRQVVTLKRIFQSVAVFWVVSTAGAIALFWNARITSWYGCVVISPCLVTSIFSYTKSSLTLRHQSGSSTR